MLEWPNPKKIKQNIKEAGLEMSLFISYSHKDSEFVDKLATSLIEKVTYPFKDSGGIKR